MFASRRLSTRYVVNSTRRFLSTTPPPPPPSSTSNNLYTKGRVFTVMLLCGTAGLGAKVVSEILESKRPMPTITKESLELAKPQASITHYVYMDIEFQDVVLPIKLEDKEVLGLTDEESLIVEGDVQQVGILKDGRVTERIIIGLYGDACPKTTENYVRLCSGTTIEGYPKVATYEGSPFHRIIPGFMAQGGDYTDFNGQGGLSVFKRNDRMYSYFPDENFHFKHTGLGVLSMANRGKDTNTSQFFLCFAPAKWLDDRHVVFGQVAAPSARVLMSIDPSKTTETAEQERIQLEKSMAKTLRKLELLGSSTGDVHGGVVVKKCGLFAGKPYPQ